MRGVVELLMIENIRFWKGIRKGVRISRRGSFIGMLSE